MTYLGYIVSIGLLLTMVVDSQQQTPKLKARRIKPPKQPKPPKLPKLPKLPKPPKPPKPTKPLFPEPEEPNHLTTLPPPLPPGPVSVFPDCPRECLCPPDHPNALYCDSRNLRVVPFIPPRIEYLYLQNNFIESLPEGPFQNATGLKWINLDNNRISSRKVDKGLFNILNKVLFLYMDRNRLDEVPANLPPSLEQLRLARNQISKIPPGSFRRLGNLTLLDLHHNKLPDKVFNKNTFKGLKSLMQLNLAHNSLKKMPPTVPPHIFQLFLDRNRISQIPDNYFKNLHQLTFLRLNFNQLTDTGIPNGTFNLSSLLGLHLCNNKLNSIPVFNPKLEHLYLSYNYIEKINGTQICPSPVNSVAMQAHDLEAIPRLRYLRLDGNALAPPIPIDFMMCFRLLQAIVI
ncbi:prolargin [Hemitrygon akajei]|uniref:prolargin n=1 Tax=Hemitrygon akajei TaxID=2704970 RepID=UPI003BF9FC92